MIFTILFNSIFISCPCPLGNIWYDSIVLACLVLGSEDTSNTTLFSLYFSLPSLSQHTWYIEKYFARSYQRGLSIFLKNKGGTKSPTFQCMGIQQGGLASIHMVKTLHLQAEYPGFNQLYDSGLFHSSPVHQVA